MKVSLYNNGALNPDHWRPSRDNYSGTATSDAKVGHLIGWRYGAWRIIEITPINDVDLKDEDREGLEQYVSRLPDDRKQAAWDRQRPFHIAVAHESGPLIRTGVKVKTLHDGRKTLHFSVNPMQHTLAILAEPYRTCSCHGHIWPCQDIDRSAVAQHDLEKFSRIEQAHAPGVCASCLEPITTRQRSLTFPELSRILPGAPGPTFHAGRGSCWSDAERYEREGRLTDNPDIARLASCPGIRFIHEARNLPAEQRLECTAGPFCTGLHGPAGYRNDPPCYHKVVVGSHNNQLVFPRPERDCGYRSGAGQDCLGSGFGGSASVSPTAGDLLWDLNHRRRNRG